MKIEKASGNDKSAKDMVETCEEFGGENASELTSKMYTATHGRIYRYSFSLKG